MRKHRISGDIPNIPSNDDEDKSNEGIPAADGHDVQDKTIEAWLSTAINQNVLVGQPILYLSFIKDTFGSLGIWLCKNIIGRFSLLL